MRIIFLRIEVDETGNVVLEIAENDRNTTYVKYVFKSGED